MATGAATLGIDIGTFESKAVLADGDGRILAQASVAHGLIVPRPGWAEHRAEEDWWADLARLARGVLAQSGLPPERIAALAVSAIGPCMLPVDAAGRPLTNAVLYGVDTRASAEIAELETRLGDAAIRALGGNGLTSQSVGPKILWLQRNRPEAWAATRLFHTSTSWLVWRLTGAAVIDHYTAASFTPLYDIARQDWAADLAGICRRDQLPRLMWSTEVAGRVTARAAAETGLAEGTPVSCGTIDAAAEAVSVGLRTPGDMMLMYGSTVFVILLADGRLADPRLWHAPWLSAGRHAAMAGLATSGTLTRWFRDELARDADFEGLAAEAATSPPGARGLIVLPHFSGERTPLHDPGARGAVFGLDLTHGRGDLYRALLEGIACATRAITETYAEAGQRPARVRAVGGGTRNRVWLQATSDLTRLDQTLCNVTIGAAYGDAFLAALASGLAVPADIDRWNPPETIIAAAAHPAYDQLYPLFQRLYRQTRDIAAALEAGGDAV
jgi:xylulokinase